MHINHFIRITCISTRYVHHVYKVNKYGDKFYLHLYSDIICKHIHIYITQDGPEMTIHFKITLNSSQICDIGMKKKSFNS